MGVQVPELLQKDLSGITYGVAGIAAATVVIIKLSRGPNLNAIPTLGSNSWLGSWWDGFNYLTNGIDVIQEGYVNYKSAPFKIADRFRWTVIVSSREHIEEVVRAPDEVLSLVEGTNERLNTRYILGDEVHDKPFQVGAIGVIRSQLNRSIGILYPEIRDEIVTAFDEILDLRNEEWKGVPVISAIQKVVCRTSNRLFVGLPLCRDPDWIDLNIRYAVDLGKAGTFLGLFPKFSRPLVACFVTTVARNAARGLELLGPIIEERLKYLDDDENTEKPNDLLSWLMEEAENSQLTAESLTNCVLMVNFTAILTSSMSFAHVLLYLAANPQYIQPLREEVEAITENEGWSKGALNKMRKIDSFIKECQRIEGLNARGVVRKALKDFTFADGTFIPRGTLLGIATRAIHYDEKFYESADTFKPFRFAEMCGEDGEGTKTQFVSTATDYLVFGHGKHACPGRFFAANELKSMLAHIVVAYDIKLEDNTTRPRSLRFGTAIIADPQAKVLFRRRVKCMTLSASSFDVFSL